MSTYGVFENKKTGKKLVYYPCPKNAHTSAMMFFVRHLKVENKFTFIGDKIPKYKQIQKDLSGKINLHNFLPNFRKFSIVKTDLKCCIIRDPIDRFISAYKNRILYHKDNEFKNFSIDMILDRIESENFENIHFRPQTYFLGNDLKYYSFYSNVNNIKYFEEKVNEFFGKKEEFPKIQVGGNEFNIKLTSKQLERITAIYKDDFIYLKN